MKHIKPFFKLSALVLILLAEASIATPYTPLVLQRIEEAVQQTVASGQKAVVVFDLDDTIINTRERNLRILQDFSAQSSVVADFPEEAALVKNIKEIAIKYLLTDTLKGAGIFNELFIKKAQEYWLTKFFSNEYCVDDQAIAGAAAYIRKLHQLGALIVYFSGRDEPRMAEGTRANLLALGFPIGDSQTLLALKPTQEEDDFIFKKRVLPQISAMGAVVAAFENEPVNINAFQDEFKSGMIVFLDTIHSPRPVYPNLGIHWLQDFLMP